MIKDTYLAKARPFIKWMSENLYNDIFQHSYRNRRNNQLISFASLHDAYERYQWSHPRIVRLSVPGGRTFATSSVALDALRKDLETSISDGSDEDACRAAVDVMRWGGVTAGNVRWLNANKNGLVNQLSKIRDALNSNDSQHTSLTDKTIRFNAGMTKVYSLTNEDFIIYDSRVAAALGLVVVKYFENRNDIDIAPELLFPWLPAKEGANAQNPKNRNPSNKSIKFPQLNNPPMHAEWNLKASWLLQAVIDLDITKKGKFSELEEPLRALEAALFMIGYDIPDRSVQSIPHPDPDPWIECWTLARNNQFHYRLTNQGIITKPRTEFLDKIVNDTLFKLWDHFGSGPFPLQNNATDVREGNAPIGLGVAYFTSGGTNPPDTSKLAAILEDLDVFVSVKVENARGMHWEFNPDFLQLSLIDHEIDIRIFLNQIHNR